MIGSSAQSKCQEESSNSPDPTILSQSSHHNTNDPEPYGSVDSSTRATSELTGDDQLSALAAMPSDFVNYIVPSH